MDKQQTISLINELLSEWTSDPHKWDDAQAIYERIPICSAELAHEASFRDLVRFSMHDLFRESCELERG